MPSTIFWLDLGANLDHYSTLGVSRDASFFAIKQAFRSLAMLHHPDLHQDVSRPGAEARMKRINEAYSVLCSTIKRVDYDRSLGLH